VAWGKARSGKAGLVSNQGRRGIAELLLSAMKAAVETIG
jgi:hypothetical protein